MPKNCFFMGHHDCGEDVLPLLRNAVERHIAEYGITAFYVGYYGNFDRMAAQAVLTAKQYHSGITLTRLIPYHPYDRPMPVPKGYDGTFYPPNMENVPKRYAIVRANRYMIDTSTHLIAYAWHRLGGAGNLVEYARKREKKGAIHIENLAQGLRPSAL